MSTTEFAAIVEGLNDGSVVPYLGPGALAGVRELNAGTPIPADSDSLILAINGGRPMAPKLMYEFPRAAMNLELKKGRSFVDKALTEIYAERKWSSSPLHDWLCELNVPYIIDTNRDSLLQSGYQDRAHTLVVGIARIAGTDYRFKLYEWVDGNYEQRSVETVNTSLPVLFKPLGTPTPEASFIASDADFVDYITELMGGFGLPSYLKERRAAKKYVMLGLRLTRDTERMIASDILYGSADPSGWALIEQPSEKEERFCARLGLTVVRSSAQELLSAVAQAAE